MTMAYEMRPGQGSLFKNDKKTSERHPNLKGRLMLPDGSVYWVSGWTKETSAGEKWISLALGDRVQQAGQSAHEQAKSNGYQGQQDEEIPF
jgi:hypothetical protein